MDISILNTGLGDTKITLDTKYAEQRAKVKRELEKHLRSGAAIFVSINGDDFRVDGYDDKTDELIVRRNTPVARQTTFRFPGHETKLTVVPQRAGG